MTVKGDGIVDSVNIIPIVTADFTKENKILLNMRFYLQVCNNDDVLSMFYRVLSCITGYVSPSLEVGK